MNKISKIFLIKNQLLTGLLQSDERRNKCFFLVVCLIVGVIVAACAVAYDLEVEPAKIAFAVRNLQPVQHRLEIKRNPGGITIIDDAFNSNPTGARMAVEGLSRCSSEALAYVVPGSAAYSIAIIHRIYHRAHRGHREDGKEQLSQIFLCALCVLCGYGGNRQAF